MDSNFSKALQSIYFPGNFPRGVGNSFLQNNSERKRFCGIIYNVMRCAIQYHLCNLKKREKHLWMSVTLLKVTLFHVCFSRFLKLYKQYPIAQSVIMEHLQECSPSNTSVRLISLNCAQVCTLKYRHQSRKNQISKRASLKFREILRIMSVTYSFFKQSFYEIFRIFFQFQIISQQTFRFSQLTIEAIEKDVKYVQS